MKAIICRELGSPNVLRLEELSSQNLVAHEVRIQIRAAAINFPDILMVAGKYQHKPSLPFVPGFEVAGEIVETMQDCIAFKVGDRVMATMRTGGYAEECVVPTDAVRHIPTPFDFPQAASFQVGHATAYVSLVRRGKLNKNETLLVHGATGGVGLAAVQLGSVLGAEVIATVSKKEKAVPAKLAGADHVIILDKNGFKDQVKELTRGNGADVIYDPVGGDIFDESLRCIAWGGRLLVVGFAGSRISNVPANRILIKGCSIIGVRAGEFARRNPTQGSENYEAMIKLANDGRLKPHVHAQLPLHQAADAMTLLIQRQAIGKVVLIP